MKLHHIGVAAADIEKTAARYRESLGYEKASGQIEDKFQQAVVQFLSLKGSPHFLEIVSPNSDKSPLKKFAASGAKLHHLCYQTPDINSALQKLRESGFFIIQEPAPAAAFPGRSIAWAMDSDKNLIELVEEKPGEDFLRV
ncbi:MAG: VOC family protein [Opitutales bacterium]|nr:VOC family protein [Opitutales bacterium]